MVGEGAAGKESSGELEGRLTQEFKTFCARYNASPALLFRIKNEIFDT